MHLEGVLPDMVTFLSCLKACGSLHNIQKGREIHADMERKGLLGEDVACSLVSFYAECGSLLEAQQVFNKLHVQDVNSWNALIVGYMKNEHELVALNCFEQMEREGVSPNEITFLCVLTACLHSGKLNDAQMYYENIVRKYGMTPTIEHHTCMVVVFGLLGHFDKVISMIKTVPSTDVPSVWITLLSFCRKWGNVELGRFL